MPNPPTHATPPYFDFQVDTSNYSQAEIRLSYVMLGTNDWKSGGTDNQMYVHTSNDNGTTWVNMPATGICGTKGKWILYDDTKNGGVDFTAANAATGNVFNQFQGQCAGRLNSSCISDARRCDRSSAVCFPAIPSPPTLAKSFSTHVLLVRTPRSPPAATVHYSTLTFTVTQCQRPAAWPLTRPSRLVVAEPPTVSAFSCPVGYHDGRRNCQRRLQHHQFERRRTSGWRYYHLQFLSACSGNRSRIIHGMSATGSLPKPRIWSPILPGRNVGYGSSALP